MALPANQWPFQSIFWIPPFHTDSHPCIRIGGPVDCIGGPVDCMGIILSSCKAEESKKSIKGLPEGA